MTIAEQLSGEAFEAALKSAVRKDSHYSLDKCNNAMKRLLKILDISPRDVQKDADVYFALRDRICRTAEKM